MKHVELDYHFVRKLVQQGLLQVAHVLSKEQLAGMLIKPLPSSSVELLCSKIDISDRPTILRGIIEILIFSNPLDSVSRASFYINISKRKNKTNVRGLTK